MQVVSDDERYEAVAPSFQCALIDALNRALKDNGVADADRRRRVCGQFAFDVGDLLDGGWVKPKEGKRAYPVLCFADRRLSQDEEADAKVKLCPPGGGFEYHGYAPGSVGYYFEDCGERLKAICTTGAT
jgi:hypothetical protein